jgi:hypothetical protein
MALDIEHTFTLTVAGTDRWGFCIRRSLTMTDAEGGQIDTLDCELEDATDVLTVTEWQEVIWTADGATKLFGGYVVKVTPSVSGGTGRKWALRCESYATRLNRCPRLRVTYVNTTPGAIVAALFTAAGLTDFDTATHVTAGSSLPSFVTDGEALPKILDRLALIQSDIAGADWVWRIDADKKVWFGPSSSDTAPFSVTDAASADYVNSFPVNAEPTKEVDATGIINRVTVRGGAAPSADTTETFSGDGATVRFAVAHRPIRDIVCITVGGVLQSHGVDWYDTFGGGYDCLVDYADGIVRWPDGSPPAAGTNNISVTYRYDVAVTSVRTDAASFAQYGLYFDYEVQDSTILDQATAERIGDAILDAYAFGVVGGTFDVWRLGIRAGQRVQVEYSALGLTGYYVARQVTTVLDPGGDGVICTVRFGGYSDSFSAAVGGGSTGSGDVGGGSGGQGGYQTVPTPLLDGEVGLLRIRTRIELIDPTTNYVEP